MNIAFERSYRLVARGGMGLACDKNGVTLGAAELVRRRPEPGGGQHYEVRPFDKLAVEPQEVVLGQGEAADGCFGL
jgi:hypothetical protein